MEAYTTSEYCCNSLTYTIIDANTGLTHDVLQPFVTNDKVEIKITSQEKYKVEKEYKFTIKIVE
jgi:MinD-like ATPase involved in chromosome partitioning or flagellar assembly